MTSDEADETAQMAKKIDRLERRLDRERRAREEAEQIAETGLRSLYDANQALDRRILERTAELHEALKVAETANDAKSWFLSQMSHQLNTPLNGLMGMLELLTGELRDEQAQQWHGSAMRSAHRLQRLTTRLITYVELEGVDLTGRGEPRELGSVLTALHDRWQGPCLRAGQLLAVELKSGVETLTSNPPELDLLFDELMSNVVEHAGPGAVTVSGGLDGQGNELVVEIQDPGPGIDPAIVARAHNLNAVADQSRHGDDPINLGFALVDRIANGLGARWQPVDDGRSAVEVHLAVVR